MITSEQIKSSLLSRLTDQIGGVLSAPPEGAINAEMLSEASGVSVDRAKVILRRKEQAKELKRVRVKIQGLMQPQSYYIEAK